MDGEKLARLLKRLDLTVDLFASTIGVHRATVFRWLNGEVEIPKARQEHIKLVASSRGVRV